MAQIGVDGGDWGGLGEVGIWIAWIGVVWVRLNLDDFWRW